MKIIELRAENIKNLKAVEIRPDGAVILEGKNGAGKSAILDSIFMALTGKKIEQPIREGEKRGEINVDLGTYKVRRIFTEKTNRLEVTNSEGAVFKTPQTMLDEILGDLTFDPLAFANQDGKSQRALLAKLVGLDFTELNAKRLELYNERTIKNREIKGGDPTSFKKDPYAPLPLEALVGGMEKPAEETPREEVSLEVELASIENLEQEARKYQDIREQVDIDKTYVDKQTEAIAKAHQEIEDMKKRIVDLEAGIKEEERVREELLTRIEQNTKIMEADNTGEQIVHHRERLRTIEETNKKIRKAVEFDAAIAKLEAAKKDIAKLEEGMAKIDLEKQERIAAAIFPIEGLGLDDETVIYQGKPFSQLSTGEQIRVSTAIAMAINPKLKILLVRDGSLLDKAGLEEIIKLAQDKDYQLWVERVSDEKQVGIYLEDGEVKA